MLQDNETDIANIRRKCDQIEDLKLCFNLRALYNEKLCRQVIWYKL